MSSMKTLVNRVNELKKNKALARLVKKRLKEFEHLGNPRFPRHQKLKVFKCNKNHFSELCFCMLTANASAESGMKCQKALGNKVKNLSEKQLSQELRRLKYRFPNKRAHYISQAQEKCNALKEINSMNSKQAREFTFLLWECN